MRVLILDNYDSFTYNLYDYSVSLGHDVTVLRNDAVSLEEIDAYSHIILSPGPGLPKNAGIMPKLIQTYINRKAILGVCLGMQAIAENCGAELYNLEQVRHGRQLMCKRIGESRLLKSVPETFSVGLYHSWAVRNLPTELIATSYSEEDVLMSFEHRELPVYGVQFHPESILTEYGKEILANFFR